MGRPLTKAILRNCKSHRETSDKHATTHRIILLFSFGLETSSSTVDQKGNVTISIVPGKNIVKKRIRYVNTSQ